MCHRVAQEPAAAVPPRQVPVIRSNSEAHAWLKLKKRGRKLALRVLTFPTFRQHDERLLICATNSVRSLDSAFLRPGRFDYVIPVGPPDDAARKAIWNRYLGALADGVEVDKLVEAPPRWERHGLSPPLSRRMFRGVQRRAAGDVAGYIRQRDVRLATNAVSTERPLQRVVVRSGAFLADAA